MKRYKKLLALGLSLVLLLSNLFAFGLTASAATGAPDFADVPATVVNEFGIAEDDVNAIIPLYTVDDSVIAYCLLFQDGGYVIYDLQGVVVQYSPTDGLPISASSPRVYYTGPSMFYFRVGDVFKLAYDQTVEKTKSALSDNAVVQVMEDRATTPAAASTTPNASNRTTYTPRAWSYNPTGICAGTAAATLLAYYDDHINGGTVPDLYMTSDGVSLTKMLAIRIYDHPGVSCATGNRNVFNWFFRTYSTGSAKNYTSSTSEAGWSTVYSFVKSNISRNRPLEVYFQGDGINHAVCCYGWEDVNGTSRFRCADGWGGTNHYFSANYLYAGINISG